MDAWGTSVTAEPNPVDSGDTTRSPQVLSRPVEGSGGVAGWCRARIWLDGIGIRSRPARRVACGRRLGFDPSRTDRVPLLGHWLCRAARPRFPDLGLLDLALDLGGARADAPS